MSELIWIPFNTPSLKNSKIKTSRGIFPSKTVKKYLQSLGIQKYSSSRKEVVEYKTRPNLFRETFEKANWIKPDKQVVLGMHFVRNSKRSFDLNNASQILMDILVAHDYLEDDSVEWVVPFYFKMNDSYWTIDKNNPGAYITIIE